jgi:hypothetical protein
MAHLVGMGVHFLFGFIRDVPAEKFFDRPELAISLVAAASAAIATSIVGAISISRHIDRSRVVVLTTLVSFLPTAFFLGETLSVIGILPPH